MLYECKDVMNSKVDEEKLHIQIETPKGMPALEADRDKIKQVVLNLLSNAIKHNRPNGAIILRGDFSATEILIAVQDTGVGIPEEALSHLFQKFYRVRENETKVAGTGSGTFHLQTDRTGPRRTYRSEKQDRCGNSFQRAIAAQQQATTSD